MARTRTLAQLRGDVCNRADVTDGGTTGRHLTTRLTRYVNQAIQKYQATVIETGGQDWFMKRTGLSTMSTSTTRDAAGWAPNMYVALPTDFLEIIGIDLVINGRSTPLQQFERAERTMFQPDPWLVGNNVGQPVYFRIGGTNNAGSKLAQIIPFAGSAYQYEILYIPVIADLSADGDTFDGVAGFEEFVVDCAAAMVLLTDANVSTPLYQSIKEAQIDTKREMKFRFATMAGPGRRMDTERIRVRSAWLGRGDLR